MSVIGKTAGAAPTGAREYLTFRLDQEEYGIDILKVQEIRGYEPPTRIANAPAYLKGVVDLRGVIVPEGKHRVEMHYTAPRAKLGGVISLLMLGALAVLFILSRKNAAHVN